MEVDMDKDNTFPEEYDNDSDIGKKIAGVVIPLVSVLLLFAVLGGVYYMMNKDAFSSSKKTSGRAAYDPDDDDDDDDRDDDDDDDDDGDSNASLIRPEESELNAALAAAGAGTGDITISLMWYNSDDVDLHVETPNGFELYYGNRDVQNGHLDVDANAEVMMDEPVENIYFEDPAVGSYSVWIEDYSDRNDGYTSYIVRITVDGHSRLYEGHIDGSGTDVDILTFGYHDS
jgi:hypothetical protein